MFVDFEYERQHYSFHQIKEVFIDPYNNSLVITFFSGTTAFFPLSDLIDFTVIAS